MTGDITVVRAGKNTINRLTCPVRVPEYLLINRPGIQFLETVYQGFRPFF